MATYGDDRAGFSIDGPSDAVVVTARGFWSIELCAQLAPAVMEALRAKGARAALRFDLTELRPLREEGQAAFRSVMIQALLGGTRHIEFRGASALTKLQILRLRRELDKEDRIRVD